MEFTDAVIKELKSKKEYDELNEEEQGIFEMDLPCPLCPRSHSEEKPEEADVLISWLALEQSSKKGVWTLKCPQGHTVYYDWGKKGVISLSWKEPR